MLKQVAAALLAAVAAICISAVAAPAGATAFGPLSSFGSFGAGAGQMESPGGLDIAADGTTYVADVANNRVDAFSPEGAFLFAFGKGVDPAGGDICAAASGCRAGVQSMDSGGLHFPEDVAIGNGGSTVYVADSGNNRVDAFSPQGAFQFAFGREVNAAGGDVCFTNCKAGVDDESAASLRDPLGVATAPDGAVFVTNRNNHRVDVFSSQGVFEFAFGKGVAPGGGDVCTATTGCQKGSEGAEAGAIALPHGIEVVGATLLVADEKDHRVDAFSLQGAFTAAFGRNVAKAGGDICLAGQECQAGGAGAAAGELSRPVALATAPGGFYVSDGELNRVAEYSMTSGFLRAFGVGVIDGSEAFQECTAASGCRTGSALSAIPGATSSPFGLGVDCRGAIYVAEGVASHTRIERFGEAGALPPPCSTSPPAPPPGAVSNLFRFGKLKLNRRRGTATLAVTVPGPGALTLRGRGVRRAAATPKLAGTVRLTIRAVGAAKRRLSRTGRAKVRALVTFAPTGGTPLTRPRAVVLKLG